MKITPYYFYIKYEKKIVICIILCYNVSKDIIERVDFV